MSVALHHQRKHKENRFVIFTDKFIYFVSMLTPLMTIPQLIKIWVEKDISGVSIISWGAYLLLSFFWLIYGFVHKEKPIILTYILWILVESFIVIGIILH